MSIMKKNEKVKELWGQQFEVVKNGLDEAQVVAFIKQLMDQQKAAIHQQDHLASSRTLAETMMIAANEASASIMEEARREAEAEVAKIAAESGEKARQIGASTEKAINAVQEVAEEILQAARQQAAAIQANGQEQAELIVTRTRQKVEYEIAAVVKEVYENLRSHLENLIGEVRALGVRLESSAFSPPELKATPATLSGAEKPQPEQQVTTEDEAELDEMIEYLNQLREQVAEEQAQAGSEADSSLCAQAPAEPSDIQSEVEEPQSPALYQGLLELAMVPPVDVVQLRGLDRRLRESPWAMILATGGSADSGSTITLLLERETPVVYILNEMLEVQAVEEEQDSPASSHNFIEASMPGHWSERPLVKRLIVTLKNSEEEEPE